ncbi:MAG TPA: cohesin domain-containing protein [Patescibacteria group bacterium]|nr:cohesin domain-containing protein [Patescibacteria group bacterium]
MKKVFLGLGLPIVLFGFVKFAHAATLTLTPPSGTYQVGDAINVNINVDTEGAAIDGIDVYSLHYNPSILEIEDADSAASGVQITAGTLLPQTLTNTVNSGLIQFSQVTTGGTTYTGSGVLATINFKALAGGTSNLTFDFTPGSTSDTNVAGAGTDKLTSVGTASLTVEGDTNSLIDASKYPSGMFIKYASDATVYLLNGGTKYPITDWTVYQNRVPSSRAIITIPDSVTFPTGSILGLRSGTLIKTSTNPTVYLFDGSHRLAFTSENDFLSLGYAFSQVYVIDDANLFNSYPIVVIDKPTFSRPWGTLFKYANNPTVYYLDSGSKKAFTSMFMFQAWYDRLDQVVVFDDAETFSDSSSVVKLPDGVVVQVQGQSQYYLIANGVAHPLDAAFMQAMGITTSQHLTISQDDLDRQGTIGSTWQ